MRKIIVISGPTASGKSAFALALARQFLAQDMEPVIINADSMQVYKEIPIITAQPTEKERREIPHRLYGVISASESCSAGRWVEMATEEIKRAFDQNQLPILVGGTGLYLKSLIYGIAEIPEISPEIRESVQKRLEKIGVEKFYAELVAGDSAIENKIDKNNPKRLLRAAEVFEQTGISIAEWQKKSRITPFPREYFDCYFLNPPRKEIYANCNRRFSEMAKNGAVEEVRSLLSEHLSTPGGSGGARQFPAMTAHGVPELIKYINGEMSLEDAIAKAQKNTRNYVKRQITWFKHQFTDFTELKKNSLPLEGGAVFQKGTGS